MSKTTVGTRRLNKSDDRYSSHHSLAIEDIHHQGKGNSVWNPEKILSAIRNLARWQSIRTLLHHRTKLWCEVCQAVQPVIDYKPLANVAVLNCRHDRSISTMSEPEYSDLVRRAKGLQIVRNPVLGGYTITESEGREA